MNANIHQCKTCGKVAGEHGHLCDPLKLDKAYVCEHCGSATEDPRHICKPKLEKINFVCIACGRVAQYPNKLCNPRDIELMTRQDPPETIF